MIYQFRNTYTIHKYCVVEADTLNDAIEKLKLLKNKFERMNDKETLIEESYRCINDWKNLDIITSV